MNNIEKPAFFEIRDTRYEILKKIQNEPNLNGRTQNTGDRSQKENIENEANRQPSAVNPKH